MKSLYLFTRDLRVDDNRGLWEACARGDKIVPVYVLDLEQLGDRGVHPGDPRFTFILQALERVSQHTRLRVLTGRFDAVMDYLLGKYRFERVYVSYPHTEVDRERIQRLEEICEGHGVKLSVIWDNVLVDYTKIGETRQFTSFYNKWKKLVDDTVVETPPREKFTEIDEPGLGEVIEKNKWRVETGASWSIAYLAKRLLEFDFSKYATTKDYPGTDGTSRLSPYISHGIVSVRTVYHKAKSASEEFVRQLAWREYYYYLMHKYPWMRSLELKPFMRNLDWNRDSELFKAFIEGRTGYPIIDAGIRQLKKENWMHNRMRLIVANFLVKDLHIDWRQGEEFFKKFLIDYDEAINVGNWQWAASAGVDPLPIRVFNPILQSAKYDPDCTFIKRHVPELEGFKCEELHNPLKHRLKGYFEPIVDHYVAVEEFKAKVFNRRS
ncbi:MAG: deoxyribodipyrimidine photo-lyase [Thermosphaera sp.]